MSYTDLERSLRAMMCRVGSLMHFRGYIDGGSGNISARLGDDAILITPSGISKGFMQPDQMLIVDMGGRVLGPTSDANRELRPTSELPMHLECYARRPDIGAVIHAHPPTAVALTIAGVSFQRPLIPEAILVLGAVPVTEYATPSSEENRHAIRDLIAAHDVIMLSHHGSLTVGPDLWDAYMKLESLEHTARILFMVEQMGGGRELTPEQVGRLLETRRRMGLGRLGEELLYCERCHAVHIAGMHLPDATR